MKQYAPTTTQDDAPFPSVAPRNGLQEYLELPLMLCAMPVPAGGAILEVGCGRGVALPVLGDRLQPSSITGVDVDANALSYAAAHARNRCVKARLHLADVRMLPFDDASFDVVFDFGTCYHIGDAARALREIARVLRPGGLFVTETVLSQFLAHPLRTRGRALPWREVPQLRPMRHAGLWQMRRKTAAT
jgi:ubiquinone/menaquinone biosynthesis C-methylase UbiE